MSGRSFRILLANHHTEALPPSGRALTEPGITLSTSANLVETVARIAAEEFDLVVLQPLASRDGGFEIERVLAARGSPRPFSALLLLPEATAIPRGMEQLDAGADDFILGSPAAGEFEARIQRVLACRTRLRHLDRLTRSLEKESITDFKTGLQNDRFFFQRLREEVARTKRHRMALALILLDFDHFKTINDEFDHVFGDFVLLSFARKLRTVVRQIDIPARLGGDEFALLLPNTDLEEAAQLAARLGTMVAEHHFEKDGHSARVTLSIGVDSMQGDEPLEPEDFLRRADRALLEAKKRGRNRICLYPEVEPTAEPPPPRS